MSKRKPHNPRVRLERSCRALLNTNHVAVVNINPSGRQGLINWKNCKNITGRNVVDAVCDIPHRWIIYVSAMCQDHIGVQYIKSVEIAPQGTYLAEHLTDAIEATYASLLRECNPKHVVAFGWIAIPSDMSLAEDQAARVFDAVGAWNQQKAA